MSSAKLAALLASMAIVLSACGTSVQPGSGSRGRIDDPRTTKPNRVACLRAAHLQVTELGANGLQIGSPPAGATIIFAPTAGGAQQDQIEGRTQDAAVIGSALLYPHKASDSELTAIENCLATGVKG